MPQGGTKREGEERLTKGSDDLATKREKKQCKKRVRIRRHDSCVLQKKEREIWHLENTSVGREKERMQGRSKQGKRQCRD